MSGKGRTGVFTQAVVAGLDYCTRCVNIRYRGKSMRRKKADGKTTEIKIRISPKSKAKVLKSARRRGVGMSAYVRKLLEKETAGQRR